MTTIYQRSENGLNWQEDDVGETVHLLRLLLVGSTIANFEYWSEFIVRLQRDERLDRGMREFCEDLHIPPMFCLRMRNSWWVGDRAQWDHTAEKFPIKPPQGIPRETSLQASIVVKLLGSTIKQLSICDLGDLEILLSNGDELHLAGAGGKWDESWILELPTDDPDQEKWSVVCDSEGVVYAKWPGLLRLRP